MCGIVGIFAYHYAASDVNMEELRKIRDHMSARGPDGSGEWLSQNRRVGLGHRRLAIIDLSEAANQPMASSDERHMISFNGEIYNYKELREQLEQKGRRFQTQSDTEVILKMYAEYGTDMLPKLRGMFAFTLWDQEKRKMLLARDPYGIKPLYYADDGWTLRVASQVKALLASPRVSRIREPAGIVGFFLMGSVPEPFTLYQEIRQLPAGHFFWIDATGTHSPESFYSISEVFKNGQREEFLPLRSVDMAEQIQTALKASVRHHFTADVPVGLFLSSGLDSSSIASLSSEYKADHIQAVTLAFTEFSGSQEDETPLAEETAQRLKLRHQVYLLSRREFANDLPLFFQAMDQPTLDGLNTYFISKAAKACGLKVALSGVGGDELFGGYPSFEFVPRMTKLFSIPSKIPGGGVLFRFLWKYIFEKIMPVSPKTAGLLTYGGDYAEAYFLKRGLFMPWELPQLVQRDLAQHGMDRLGLMPRLKETISQALPNAGVQVSILESSWYLRNQLLRDTDWASMAHSFEIRTPFVDSFLLKDLAGILVKNCLWGKKLLVQAMGWDLSDKLCRRKKTGFVLPMQKWIQHTAGAEGWRRVPLLSQEQCPWSRRWAYEVYERMAG